MSIAEHWYYASALRRLPAVRGKPCPGCMDTPAFPRLAVALPSARLTHREKGSYPACRREGLRPLVVTSTPASKTLESWSWTAPSGPARPDTGNLPPEKKRRTIPRAGGGLRAFDRDVSLPRPINVKTWWLVHHPGSCTSLDPTEPH